IDTQNVLLKELGASRLIEIGPSNILINMLKRTLKTKGYQQHDAANGLFRQLLCYRDNSEDLNNGLTTESEIQQESTEYAESKKPEPKQTSEQTIPSPPEATPSFKEEAVKRLDISDAPVPADIPLKTIMSQKLGRVIVEKDMHKSIKELCNGRSTLENETIGDLEAEFGSIPHRAEDLELQALAKTLQSSHTFAGQPGRITAALVSKTISLKMPGDFRISHIRSYLENSWGLKISRQNYVLLQLVMRQPQSRIASGEARLLLDGIAQKYLEQEGLLANHAVATKSPSSSCITSGPHQGTRDPLKDAMELAKFNAQARYLQIDLHAGKKAEASMRARSCELEDEIQAITAELGRELIVGIRNKWTAGKVRHFDSYWNWALQDLMSELYRNLQDLQAINEPKISFQVQLMANRAFPRLLKTARYLLGQTSALPEQLNTNAASAYLRQVIKMADSQSGPPTIRPFVQRVLGSIKSPHTVILEDGEIIYQEVPRIDLAAAYENIVISVQQDGQWVPEKSLINSYQSAFKDENMTFSGRTVLLVGASPQSIGSEILRGLLVGGAVVIVTTNNFCKDSVDHFRSIYKSHGARGSQLHLCSFNQASQQDVHSLIDWIYDPKMGLGLNLDQVIPFAAIPENGRELDAIDSTSELAHRMMLLNVFRILGYIKRQKVQRGFRNHVTQVLLPLSPNHGIFGGDGLYAESKLGLETLLTRWHSESWGSFLSVCGTSIGWTRGTGLMKTNDMIAEGIEGSGVRTFCRGEMALYVLMLMSEPVVQKNETAPLYVDLTGGLKTKSNLKEIITEMRGAIKKESSIRKAVAADAILDSEPTSPGLAQDEPPSLRVNYKSEFPVLPDYEHDIRPLTSLEGIIDLSRVVVVTGIGEIGPHGNARTRWEMEVSGQFSIQGCIDLAWMMGLIKHHNGQAADGQFYNGWVDAKTNQPVKDYDVKSKYERTILDHTGIRLVEEAVNIGYGPDPSKYQMLREVVLTEDLPSIAVSADLADHLQAEYGDRVEVYCDDSTPDEVQVWFKKGSTILVPTALPVEHAVAGQIPTGWDPKVYGISDDVVANVDRVTLFTLVSVAEALLSSGVTDAYEFYQHIHISQIASCIGSGVGGMQALKDIFRHRYQDKPVRNDVLQDAFINTAAAWVNMLLISSAGPIRTPVGACATALESLESGYELITSGKAKVCLVGGVDDLDRDISVEFANMRATSDPAKEREEGRVPAEASRPATSSRAGFVESHGSGVQVLTTAQLALDMGLPIRGIIAWAGTASDKAGRSVPAPGQGLLVNAREEKHLPQSPLLSLSYRKKRSAFRRRQIDEWEQQEMEYLDGESDPALAESRQNWVRLEASRQRQEVLSTFGHAFWNENPQISPIRGCLAVWGLTIDDLDFVSCHGTSTTLNDLNETEVLQKQLSHLGRQDGNILPAIFQKYLTGHSKGAAAAWMLNGCVQALDSNIIPGQRNADNIDKRLMDRDHFFYPCENIRKPQVKAFSVTSFGFGQKGAQAIGIHPRYLFAALSRDEFEEYAIKVKQREKEALQKRVRAMVTNTVCVVKTSPPWAEEEASSTMLNPNARFST
ncbi:hypothetical protein IL306_005198, partial [Fusarium sp. DS 682]